MKITARGTNQQSSAPYNRRVVLDLIRQQGAMSRKEIVDSVSLSPQTVTNITNDLEAIGLIVSRRQKADKARGQPPIEFALNPAAGGAIGISLENGKASAALVSLVGEVQERRHVEVDTSDPQRVLLAMLDLVRELRRGAQGRIWGVGVALPGPLVTSEVSFIGPTSLEGWGNLAVLDDLRHATGLPVFYSVDSVAGALGENLFGVAKSIDNFFYLHMGMGLGGVLVDGRSAYRGASGNATEIGHIPVVKDGRACYCGNSGCLERYVSLFSLAEALGVESSKIHDSPIEQWIEQGGQPAFTAWCESAAACLRDAICTIENMLDPHTIVIGGSAPKALVAHLVELAQPLHRSVRGGVPGAAQRIMLSEREQDSSILGAAVLPLYDMLSPRLDVLQSEPRSELDAAELLGQQRRTGSV
ncbi:ROK family protein [Pseudoduganella sp. FT93W]|uniref:ROK family protein n=1 Tax=Duganella fentianensis TaxID=2692177 RepID=A0A845HX97_9BURK|nr:ROK family transcriptional regulator [Duganella fentianensis]MYN45609.1 ROK family protein [Duganella fentianensis]